MALTDEYRAVFVCFDAKDGRFAWTWNWAAAFGGVFWFVSKGMTASAITWTVAFIVLGASLWIFGVAILFVITGCVANWAYYRHWSRREGSKEIEVAHRAPASGFSPASTAAPVSLPRKTSSASIEMGHKTTATGSARLEIRLANIPETSVTIKPLTILIDGVEVGEAPYRNGEVATLDVIPGSRKILIKNLWRNHVYDVRIPGEGSFAMTLKYSNITGSFGKQAEMTRLA